MSYSYTLNKITLTDAGRALLQRAIGGEELSFSSVALGNGVPPVSFAYTGLANEKLRVPVRKVTSYSNKTIVNTFISNESVTTAFDVYEIGIFAIDPSTHNSILYAYGYFNPKTDTIPAASTSVMEEVYEIEVYTSNAENITATIDTSLVYALQSDLEDLEAEVTTAKSDITDIQSQLNDFAQEDDLVDLAAEVAGAKTDIQNIQQNYSLITATGSKITASYNTSTNVVTLTLKNANNTTLSTATFTVPISETFVNCTYANGTLTFTQKNGSTKQVSISGLISNLVPNSRTIAGVDLVDNITKSELMTALGLNPNGNNCPSGMIVMWSGTVASIPEGWRLCNGQNGTPDLRNRFIVGAGDEYTVGNTGGEKEHTLTTDEMPSHKHNLEYYVPKSGGSVYTRATLGAVNGKTGSEVENVVKYANTSSSWSGSQAVSYDSVISNVGGGQAHENRPPYYALCFIMKI